MSDCHEPKLNFNWKAQNTLQEGLCAFFEFDEVNVTVYADTRQNSRELLAAILHEYIEVIDKLEGFHFAHPEVHNKLAYPIADFLLAHGFNPHDLFVDTT